MAKLPRNDGDRIADPRNGADSLLYDIDLEDLGPREKILLAEVLIKLGQLEAARDANLIALYHLISNEDRQGQSDRNVLRSVLRYRVRVLPPLRGGNDGGAPGGGH